MVAPKARAPENTEKVRGEETGDEPAAKEKDQMITTLSLLKIPDITKDESPEGVDDIRKKFKPKFTPGYDPGETPEVDLKTPLLTLAEPDAGIFRTPEEIEGWLRTNYWRLDYPQHFIGHEINQPAPIDFEIADLRVLCVRLSPYDAVAGSMTHSLLAMISRKAGEKYGFKVYTDQCCMPNGTKDIAMMREGKMPLLWGRTSRRHVDDFDVVLTTIALSTEQINYAWSLKHSGVNIWKAERDDLTPLYFTGGVPSDNYEMMYGPVKDETGRFREVMQDGTVVGECEYSLAPFLAVIQKNRNEHWNKVLGDGWGQRSLTDIRQEVGKRQIHIQQKQDKTVEEKQIIEYGKDWTKEEKVNPLGGHRALKAKTLKEFHTTVMHGRTPGKEDAPGIPGFYEPDAYQPHWQLDDKTGYKEYRGVTVKADYKGHVPKQVRRAIVPTLDEVKTNEEGVVHYDNMGPSTDIQISAGCSSGGNCTFCHEANSGGRWRERSLKSIIKASERAIRMQGAEEITPYSFTWSYHSRVYSILGWTYKRFGKCTLISQRADIASVDPEFFKIQRGTGKLAATIGVEGISQRIRDYLNKNCSEEQIVNAVTHAAYAGFHTVKFFMIATGYETEEDVYEFCRLLDKLKTVGMAARDWRRKTQGVDVRDIVIKPSFMTLLHEPHTPLQFAECRAAMDLETDILRPVIDKCNEHGYLFKTSLKRKHVRVSQWFSLAGREATRSMLEMVVRYDYAHHGSIHEWVTWQVEQEFKKDGYDWLYYFREKPWEYVFPWDHVIVPMSREYFWKAWEQAINFRGVPYCLRTPANSNPKCWSCTACRTPEEKLTMLQRTYETSDLLKEVRAHTKRMEPVSRVRWLLNIHEPLLRTAKKMVLGRHITRGMFLRATELGQHNLVESFLTIASHSLMQAENDQQRPWVMGRVLVDFNFNDKVKETDLRELIPYINAQNCMWGMKVEDVRVSPDMKPLSTTPYFGLYELTIPDMTVLEVRNTLEKLHDQTEVSIRRKVASGKETFRIEEVAYTKSDLVPAVASGLSADGRPRVFFLGSSKESPYYMLETILKRRGTAWKKNPIICHGYFLLNKERGIEDEKQGSAGDIFAAFKKQKLWCERTGRPIETDLFTGQLYQSKATANLSVLEDVMQYAGTEGWGANSRNWKIADREPQLVDIEDVAQRQVDEIEAIAADVKAMV